MNSNGQTENNEEGEDKTKPGIETGIVLYQSDGANVSVEVMYSDETFWMRQKAIAELFGVGLPTISEHLNNIFKSGELEKTSSTTSFDFSERSRMAKGLCALPENRPGDSRDRVSAQNVA